MPNEVSRDTAEIVNQSTFLQYGGQAVIEGVMMRSPNWFAVACRTPDGRIVQTRERVENSILAKLKWLNKPLLRGTLALVDAMALGARALSWASGVQLEAENAEATGAESRVLEGGSGSLVGVPTPVAPSRQSRINDIAIGGTLAFGILFGLATFVMLPTAITGVAQHFHFFAGVPARHMAKSLNAVDAVIRIVFFFAYIGLISRIPHIHAVFEYHGAEHKAINTLEAGRPLTLEEAMQSSRIHPRCGTSFIFVVLIVNLIVFVFLPRPANFLERTALHLAVVPLVAGVAYEVIKFAGRYRSVPIVAAALAPGMWTQYLTTRPPKPDQIEVALTALRSVLEAEGHMAPGAAPPIAEAAAIA